MVIKLLWKFPCVFVLFYRETNPKSGKIYLLATIKYTWCAYLSPPFTGINHYSLWRNLTWHCYLVIYDFISCFDDQVMLYHILATFNLHFINLLRIIILVAWQAWHIKFKDESTSELPRDGFSPLCISIKTFQELLYSES